MKDPLLMQDENRKLSDWLASKPDAMRHAREAAALIRGVRVQDDTVVISVKGGNEAARLLCQELIALIPNKEPT